MASPYMSQIVHIDICCLSYSNWTCSVLVGVNKLGQDQCGGRGQQRSFHLCSASTQVNLATAQDINGNQRLLLALFTSQPTQTCSTWWAWGCTTTRTLHSGMVPPAYALVFYAHFRVPFRFVSRSSGNNEITTATITPRCPGAWTL